MSDRKFSLRQMLGAVSFVDCGDIVVTGISCDSRKVKSGQLFVALPGTTVDGHDWIRSAIAAGAGAVLVERPQARIGVPQCVVSDSRTAWAQLCMGLYGAPAASMELAGVTGTNGKTTTAWLLRSILEAAGRRAGLLGTVEYHDGVHSRPSPMTTPDAEQLAGLLAGMASRATKHCVMEVSSHALDQRRCSGLRFAVAAVTNVTHDHLDYHRTLDRYRSTKARIAGLLRPGAPLLMGVDDSGCRSILPDVSRHAPVITFGFGEGADLQVTVLNSDGRTASARTRTTATSPGPSLTEPGDDSMHLLLRLQRATLPVATRLVGRHNALNCLTAAGMAEQLGVPADMIVQGLQNVEFIPGRMESIRVGQRFQVFVDYAHTPDGLQHCLQTVRERTHGRVICVFGAGGDRDRSKRPLMAQAAAAADIVFLTSDNPRSENPDAIIEEVAAGFSSFDQVCRHADRETAMRRAFETADDGDTVVIAGRGHEGIQQVGNQQICFDDRRVARRLLRDLPTTAPQNSRHGRLSMTVTAQTGAAESGRLCVSDSAPGSGSESTAVFPNRIPA